LGNFLSLLPGKASAGGNTEGFVKVFLMPNMGNGWDAI
jgi:hypothetical protein